MSENKILSLFSVCYKQSVHVLFIIPCKRVLRLPSDNMTCMKIRLIRQLRIQARITTSQRYRIQLLRRVRLNMLFISTIFVRTRGVSGVVVLVNGAVQRIRFSTARISFTTFGVIQFAAIPRISLTIISLSPVILAAVVTQNVPVPVIHNILW